MNQLLPSLVELDHHAEIQPEFGSWRTGYGPFEHALETQAAVFRLAHQLVQAKMQPDLASVYRLLQAIDRIGSAGLWLVVHMTSSVCKSCFRTASIFGTQWRSPVFPRIDEVGQFP